MQPPPPPAEPPGLRTIRFAKAPSTLEPYAGPHPIGSCSGYAPEGCRQGYASSDIFFMESCLYSMMCSNREELFSLKAGEDFECELDEEGAGHMPTIPRRNQPETPVLILLFHLELPTNPLRQLEEEGAG